MMVAGMESDCSDSEYDMVFAAERKSSKTRNPDLEFRPVPKEAVPSEFFSSVENRNETREKEIRRPTSNRNHFHNSYRSSTKQRGGKQQKRVVCQQSQPLDDLRYAVMDGNLEMVKDILSKGIMVDSILKAGWTALMYAASCAKHEIVLYLLENKADTNYHKDMFTPVMAACASTKEEADLLKCCCHLLKHGAKVNVHERHLTTPLMFAARQGHFQIVRELIDAGADLDAQDNRNQTALFLAASEGHGQIVHLLLSKGANLHAVDYAGQTAVDVAYSHGFNEVAAVLERSASKQGEKPADSESVSELVPALPRTTKDMIKSAQSMPVQRQNRKYYEKQGEFELLLNGLGFSDLIKTFNEHHLSFNDFLLMDENELEKIGISQLGIRSKLLRESKAIHKKKWENSSLQNLKQLQYISCPDAVAMMANISKHLKYISSTVVYIRNQIQSQPRILELAQDTSNVHDLVDELDENLKNLRTLGDEVRFLKLHLDKVQDNVKYIPADLIVETVPDTRQASKQTIIFLTVIVTVAIGGILWKKPRSFLNPSIVFSTFSLPWQK